MSVAAVALCVVLKHCKLQYKMDLTLKNTPQNQHVNRVFAEQPVFYNTKSTCLPRLGLFCPKVVSVHNLDHMAPFSNPRPGFCMVFRCACFWFWVPGSHFWTPDPKFGPGISKLGPGWPGEVFGPKNGGPKNMVLFGNGFEMGDCGISHDPNGLYGTQEAFGRAGLPQNPTRKLFLGISPILGNLG